MTITDGQVSEWLPDAGASAHVTGNQGNLKNLVPYAGSDTIMVGDGNKLPISHIGEANITAGPNQLLLRNVLLVPNMKKNLLSISQLTKDFPCIF